MEDTTGASGFGEYIDPGEMSFKTKVLIATETVSGADKTTVSFTGLDINTDGKYILEIKVQEANVANIELSLHINADATEANYDIQKVGIRDTGFSGTAMADNARFCNIMKNLSIDCTIDITRSIEGFAHFYGYPTYSHGGSEATQAWRSFCCSKSNGTVANITQIDITSTSADAIKIGSVFKLYKEN